MDLKPNLLSPDQIRLESKRSYKVKAPCNSTLLPMLKCSVCSSDIPETEEKCLTCGFHVGPPNVRAAEKNDEVLALNTRYNAAIDRADANGYLPILRKFDDAVKQSCAVINGDLRLLFLFVTSEKTLYATYEGGVAGRLRKPAALHDDLARRGI